jgi:hypothetical protein
VVECFLAKEDVAGSNPVSRSNQASSSSDMLAFQIGTFLSTECANGAVPKW